MGNKRFLTDTPGKKGVWARCVSACFLLLLSFALWSFRENFTTQKKRERSDQHTKCWKSGEKKRFKKKEKRNEVACVHSLEFCLGWSAEPNEDGENVNFYFTAMGSGLLLLFLHSFILCMLRFLRWLSAKAVQLNLSWWSERAGKQAHSNVPS